MSFSGEKCVAAVGVVNPSLLPCSCCSAPEVGKVAESNVSDVGLAMTDSYSDEDALLEAVTGSGIICVSKCNRLRQEKMRAGVKH